MLFQFRVLACAKYCVQLICMWRTDDSSCLL